MQTPFPPVEIVTGVYLSEALFGIGYNKLVEYAHQHRLWDVSISVTIGVTVTLIIPVAAWYALDLAVWQTALLFVGCFVFSGSPMIVGSLRRTVAESQTHKARPWPTRAAQARDDAIMSLTTLAEEISDMTRAGKLTLQHLPDVVNKLHRIIGTLKSV